MLNMTSRLAPGGYAKICMCPRARQNQFAKTYSSSRKYYLDNWKDHKNFSCVQHLKTDAQQGVEDCIVHHMTWFQCDLLQCYGTGFDAREFCSLQIAAVEFAD